jgi:lambda repressor-like predicted transcriptional regulator
MERSLKLNIVNNIIKLLDINGMSVEKLSEKSGLSVSGIYKSLKTGIFKIEAIEKIAEAFRISPIALFANELNRQMRKVDDNTINLKYIWYFTEESYILPDTSDKSLTIYYETVHKSHESFLKELQKNTELKSRYDDVIMGKDELIESLKSQLNDKNQILEYAKQENLFAYANLIQALLANRTGKDGSMDPEQLTGLTRSRIFDDAFLRKLVDQGLISDADYLYFSQQAKEKK